ncbi:helix-turn-helix transcriptional regulator [Hahella aquimaris]|uniref:helix-turn-helix domain-containing protein n=1 Tax=Hahella sp. HNIBRBA332 TaxID=3015983 RepID=UPI00273C2685|nr:helix-turn-helix transcriptional regulator [Hahella sp. HNIBRBA332]WLQ16808.1 helix-turn-helix transcriptional regulator [Hahella sp. HNIBRBA332]
MRQSRNSIAYETLRDWLKSRRKDSGMNIRTLAEKLGVSHSIVGKIEDGSRKLDIFEFVEICQALGLDPQQEMGIIVNALKASSQRLKLQHKI